MQLEREQKAKLSLAIVAELPMVDPYNKLMLGVTSPPAA